MTPDNKDKEECNPHWWRGNRSFGKRVCIRCGQYEREEAQPQPLDKEAIMLSRLIDSGKGHLFSLHGRKIIFEAMESFSASQNEELRKENELLRQSVGRSGEDYLLEINRKNLYITQLQSTIDERDKEIERLKGLMEREIKKGFRAVARITKTGDQITEEWINENYKYFKTENNL